MGLGAKSRGYREALVYRKITISHEDGRLNFLMITGSIRRPTANVLVKIGSNSLENLVALLINLLTFLSKNIIISLFSLLHWSLS